MPCLDLLAIFRSALPSDDPDLRAHLIEGVRARRHLPDGRQEAPEHRRRGHRQVRYGIFKRGGELVGQTVGVAGEHPTGAEIALTRALGKEVRYNDVPPDVFRSFGFPGADDIGNMFQFTAAASSSRAR